MADYFERDPLEYLPAERMYLCRMRAVSDGVPVAFGCTVVCHPTLAYAAWEELARALRTYLKRKGK